MKHSSLAAIALFSLMIAPLAGRAQLLLELDSVVQITEAGGQAAFTGTLTNTGTTELFLNSIGFNFQGDAANYLSGDDTPFFSNVPASLPGNGGTYVGTIYNINVAQGTPNGDYFGAITLIGGADATASMDLGTANFRVSVVPAPSALVTLFIGAVPGIAFMLRRRRT